MELPVIVLTITANLIIATAVYNNNRRSATNILLAALSLNLAAWTLFNYIALRPAPEHIHLFWVRFVMFITSPLGPLIFLLAKAFPYSKLQIKKPLLIFTITLPVITAILALTPTMFTSLTILPNGNFSLTPGLSIIIYAFNLIFFMLLGFITLIKKHRSSTGIVKKQLTYFLLGTIIAFSLMTITNFIAVVVFGTIRYTYIGPPLTLIMISFIAYAMLKHHLLEIRLLVARAVTYSFLLITLVTIASASIMFAAVNLGEGPNLIIFLIALTVLFSFIFNPLKQIFEKLTKNIFYKQPYSSEKLLESLGHIIRSTLSLNTLTKNTLRELTDTMHITRGAIIVTQQNNGHRIFHTNYQTKPQFSENTLHNLTKSTKDHLLVFDDLEESPAKMLLRQHNLAVVMPLRVKNTDHGLFLFGEKASGDIYSQQDIEVMQIIMPQLSVAIQNAKSYDEIKHFADTLKVEVNKATKDLKKANRNLRHLDKLKDEFVFIATHELKNPVTAMRGYLSMIKEGTFGKVPQKLNDPLDQLQVSNQQLVQLVNDLLQIARTEANTLTFNTTKVELCPIVNAVIGNIKPLYKQKGLSVKHICPTKNLTVQADENKLKEIINNLVSNAIKYSEKGTITITHEIKDKKVVTHVKDQGYGIHKKNHDKIFTRFFRVEKEAAKGIPGTGLGLFIVKQLVEKMSGKIWFESTVGIGTTFSFSLPQ